MSKPGLAWSGALIVMAITTVLLILDITNGPVHRYWGRHAFTASVLSGVLVLLVTVLIVDRVARQRQVRNQSRAVAAQAAIIVGQARRTVDAVKQAFQSEGNQEAAADGLRTYTQMLMTSAPVLIDAQLPRAFLESAQRLVAQLIRAMREAGDTSADDARLDESLRELQSAAAPLLVALSSQQRTAVNSVVAESSDG
jgi:hypothetical protein